MPRNLIERMTRALQDALIFGTGTIRLEPEQPPEERPHHLPIPISYGQQDAPQPLENYVVSDQQYTIPTSGIYEFRGNINGQELESQRIDMPNGSVIHFNPVPLQPTLVDNVVDRIPFSLFRHMYDGMQVLTPDPYCDDEFVYETPEGRIISYRNYSILQRETANPITSEQIQGYQEQINRLYAQIEVAQNQMGTPNTKVKETKRKSNLPDWF